MAYSLAISYQHFAVLELKTSVSSTGGTGTLFCGTAFAFILSLMEM